MARATDALIDRTDAYDPDELVARAVVSAALHDPDDRIAQAVDAAVYAHDTDHERDHAIGECVRDAVRAAILGARGEEVPRG